MLLSYSVLFQLLTSKSRAATYEDHGTAANYNLLTGDTLHIVSGTYTGSLYSFFIGAVVQVAPEATFMPAAIGNPRGKLINWGTVILSFTFNTNYDFWLENYGTMQVLGGSSSTPSVYMYGNQTWVNHLGGMLEVKHEMVLGKGSTGSSLINEGKLRVGALTAHGGTSLINRNRIVSSGIVSIASDIFINEGELDASSPIYMRGTYTNSCRLVASGGFWSNSTSSVIHNQGLLWVPFTPGNVDDDVNSFIVSGTFLAHPNSIVKAPHLQNYGTITTTGGGTSYLYFTHETYNYGTVGATPADGTIEVFDATRISSSRIFDFYYSSAPTPIHPNVSFASMAEPDTLRMVPSGCSDLFTPIPVPLTWLDFKAIKKSSVVELNWETAQEINTEHFVIERRANGQTWNSLGVIQSNNSPTKNSYRFTDPSPQPVNYYRVKQVDLDGKFTYSKTLRVVFADREGSLVISPSIIKNERFTCIVKDGALLKADQLTVRVYDASGKLYYINRVKPAPAITISCQGWPAGYYTILVGNASSSQHAKVLVQ